MRTALHGAVILLLSVFLTSCGGGADSKSETSAESRKEALATTGTWVGRAPKYEVINGITVPPEPAPTLNNSTLAGVDINNNGVRDDIERFIASKAQTSTDAYAVMTYVQARQRIFSRNWEVAGRSDALQYAKSILCVDLPETARTLLGMGSGVDGQVFNTPQRIAILKKYNISLDGGYGAKEVACD